MHYDHTIHSFTGSYRFLSNFFIEPDGSHVEGEYQAHKVWPVDWRIADMSPSQAKRVGQALPLRHDWERIKIIVMRTLVTRKFDDHPTLALQLLNTLDAELIEGNYWNDTYWGVCRGVGENHLGKILMQVRDELIPF